MGNKTAHTTVRKESGKFSRWCTDLPFTHHSYHGLWMGYSELIYGLIAAASAVAPLMLPSELTVYMLIYYIM